MALCERRVLDREIVDEGRLDQFFLDHVLEEVHEELPLGLWLIRFFELVLYRDGPELFGRVFEDLDTCVLLYRVLHRELAERLCKRDLGLFKRERSLAVNILHEGCEEVLGKAHHVIDIVVGPVDLHHCELGVVVGVDVLVPEVPCDLKDPLESADHEAF